MYGGSFPTQLPSHDPATPQPQPQQHQSWQAQQPCPISPFDLMLRPDSSRSHSGASLFDFPSMASPLAHPSGPLSHIPSPPQMLPSMLAPPGRPPLVSPFDIPNGRVQQLLANSTINSGALGRPPPSPFDLPPSGRGARWPFDVVLAQKSAAQATSSGSGGNMNRPVGLPFADARSLERSLGSEGSPPTSQEGDDLVGVPQANLERHQQQFVRYSGLSEAHPMAEWRSQDSFAAEAASFGDIDLRARAENMPVSLSMRVVAAPASFALPMVQRKVFKPPFVVRVELQYKGSLNVPMTMEVHAINDATYSKVAGWLPESEKMQAELEGNRINRQLNVSAMSYVNGLGLDLNSGKGREHLHLEDFKFSDLKWAKSSRMSKRWLIFCLRIKDDIVYLLYKLPTVVISRRTDQYSKAHEILTGVSAAATKRPRTAPMFPSSAASVPPPGTREMAIEPPRLIHHYSAPEGVLADVTAKAAHVNVDAPYIRRWIHYRYQACGFTRYLSDSDIQALLQLAGTHVGVMSSGRDPLPVDPRCWENFKNWFLKGLKTLHQCARVWNMSKPHAICGFAVSRTAAEALLAEQPIGTFLVRLCSEPGAFAISCCMEGPGGRPYVDHLLIDAVDLQSRSLEGWVHAHQYALQLLDPLSDKLYLKDTIFQQTMLPMSASMGQPRLSGPGGAALPPPLPPPAGQMRPQPSPSNLSLDHILMLANLTNPPPDFPGQGHAGGAGNMHMEDMAGPGADRELSLDVLGNLDMACLDMLAGGNGGGGKPSSLNGNLGGALGKFWDGQRLESLGNLESLSKLDMAQLGSLGNLEALGGPVGAHQRLESLSNLESLVKMDSLGQRLDSFNRADLNSGSLDSLSRQLLGSLGSLPDNDSCLKDMLSEQQQPQQNEARQSLQGEPPAGSAQQATNMDMLNAWGTLSDMGTLQQRALSPDSVAASMQMDGMGGSLSQRMMDAAFGAYDERSNSGGQDSEMCDAQQPGANHMHHHPQQGSGYGVKDGQRGGYNGNSQSHQQQQQFTFATRTASGTPSLSCSPASPSPDGGDRKAELLCAGMLWQPRPYVHDNDPKQVLEHIQR